MYRIVIFIIIILIEILFPSRRYGRRRSLFGSWNDNWLYQSDDWSLMTPAENPNTGIAARIRVRFRRRNAVKKCSKKFINKQDYIYTLKNSNVIVVFDSKNKTMTCVDNTVKGRAATVVWAEQNAYMVRDDDNIFEQTFDDLCVSFSESANYSGILYLFKNKFSSVQETSPLPQKQQKVTVEQNYEQPIHLEKNREDPFLNNIHKMNIVKLEVNKATAEELAKLPGISIILAKRIIKYRDLKGGIGSKDELYKEFKIKEHFQCQLNDLISVTKSGKEYKRDDDERIIDF